MRLCLRFAHRCVFAKKKSGSLKVEPSVSVSGDATRRWSRSADLRAELEEDARKLLQTRCRLLENQLSAFFPSEGRLQEINAENKFRY